MHTSRANVYNAAERTPSPQLVVTSPSSPFTPRPASGGLALLSALASASSPDPDGIQSIDPSPAFSDIFQNARTNVERFPLSRLPFPPSRSETDLAGPSSAEYINHGHIATDPSAVVPSGMLSPSPTPVSRSPTQYHIKVDPGAFQTLVTTSLPRADATAGISHTQNSTGIERVPDSSHSDASRVQTEKSDSATTFPKLDAQTGARAQVGAGMVTRQETYHEPDPSAHIYVESQSLPSELLIPPFTQDVESQWNIHTQAPYSLDSQNVFGFESQ